MEYQNSPNLRQTSLKTKALKLLAISSLAIASLGANAAINSITLFGDSLSDVGNTRSEVPLGNTDPVAIGAGYGANGRFSNGPLWHEYLSQSLGLTPETNSNDGGNIFAYGGARVDNDDGFSAGLLRQNSEYFARQAGAMSDPDSLFIAWAGGNDMRDLVGDANPITTIDQQLDALFGMLNGLLDSGVSQILVPNLPNLGIIPENRGTGDQASATSVTQAWNDGLLARLFDLNNSTTADVYFLDVFSLFDGLIADPASEGFTNTTDECRSVTTFLFIPISENECNNADQFVFWDEIHPTTAAHRILGLRAFDLISSGNALVKDTMMASTPAIVILFGLGLTGLVVARKTRK